MSARGACAACEHVHASTDARAVGRFTGALTFVAAHAGTPPRATRTEAEADECAWRQSRLPTPPCRPTEGQRSSKSPARINVDSPAPVMQVRILSGGPTPQPALFPAAAMETAARAEAWCDFLAQMRLSLMVWEIDGEVRTGCEHVLTWLRRCLDELDGLVEH